MDIDPECRIIPFRGEYYMLKAERRQLCRDLIYPVPDPAFPFLGVHFTRRVSAEDMEPAPAGVRAQALDLSGKLVDDFLLRESERAVHVCNAPSPAATACLTIGQEVATRLLQKMEQQRERRKKHPPLP